MNELVEDLKVILSQHFDEVPSGRIAIIAKQCAITAKAFFIGKKQPNVGREDDN